MCNHNRRDFLKNAALLGSSVTMRAAAAGGLSGLVLAAQRALASGQADPEARFVVFRIHGAMDSTQGLHPFLGNAAAFKPSDLYLGYDGADRPLEKINGTQISLGPAAAKLAPFANEMAILRGIMVGPNDFGHPFAIQHMTSGRTQETAPGWVSYVGTRFTLDDNSYVVTNAPLYRGTLREFPMHLTAVLRAQVAKLQASSSGSPLAVYGKRADTGVGHYLQLLSSRARLDRFLDAIKATGGINQKIYDDAIQRGKTVEQAEIEAHLGGASDEMVLAAALYSGLSRVGQIDIQVTEGGNLDTHAAHATTQGPTERGGHMPAQQKRWDRIADFLTTLKALGIYSKTTVVVITEFNRTPGMNANGGKDHNYPDNAAVVFGRGVNGGAVVGDHTLFTAGDGFPYAYWAGAHIDFENPRGEVVAVPRRTPPDKVPANASLIHPADLWASVIRSLDPGLKSQLPAGARVIPGLFKG